MNQRTRHYNRQQDRSADVFERRRDSARRALSPAGFDTSRSSYVMVSPTYVDETKQLCQALRAVSKRLINAQEEERRRIARELHDDINQRMALLAMELDQLRQLNIPVDVMRRLESVQRRANEISTDIHQLSYKLHPAKLEQIGLTAALKSFCREFSVAGNLEVKLEQSGLPTQLPNDVKLCIFRIAQEALRNCSKYSGAATARVTLKNLGDEIQLSISDEGCGFDPESEAIDCGLGFTSMRERARMIGGTMEIRSQPNRGTQVKVFIPLVSKHAK